MGLLFAHTLNLLHVFLLWKKDSCSHFSVSLCPGTKECDWFILPGWWWWCGLCVCVCEGSYIWVCMRSHLYCVCLFYSVGQDAWLKIKPRLFRLQCKSAHCDRVRKARVEILWQVLLFDSWLPVAAAAASPCSLGPQPWTAHGVCLTCGLCCCSNQSLHGHSYMWLAVADSWSRYSSFFFLSVSLWQKCYTLFGMSYRFSQIHLLLFGCFSYHEWVTVQWLSVPLMAQMDLPLLAGTASPGTPYSHFIPSLTSLELHFVKGQPLFKCSFKLLGTYWWMSWPQIIVSISFFM